MSATPLTVLYQLFSNFACVFLMVWGRVGNVDCIKVLNIIQRVDSF